MPIVFSVEACCDNCDAKLTPLREMYHGSIRVAGGDKQRGNHCWKCQVNYGVGRFDYYVLENGEWVIRPLR